MLGVAKIKHALAANILACMQHVIDGTKAHPAILPSGFMNCTRKELHILSQRTFVIGIIMALYQLVTKLVMSHSISDGYLPHCCSTTR